MRIRSDSSKARDDEHRSTHQDGQRDQRVLRRRGRRRPGGARRRHAHQALLGAAHACAAAALLRRAPRGGPERPRTTRRGAAAHRGTGGGPGDGPADRPGRRDMTPPAPAGGRALICGSLAFDTIMVFADRFANHILPDKIHILNVSFLVPKMRREFGGCAGNIAYNLKLLGERPLIMATVSDDFQPYAYRL